MFTVRYVIASCYLYNYVYCLLIPLKIEPCNKTLIYRYDVSKVNITRIGNEAFLNGHVTFIEPVGDNINFVFTLMLSTSKDNYVKLGTIKGDDGCKALKNYLGGMWTDIERAAHRTQIGYCPIEKGRYKLSQHKISTGRMNLQGLPKGYLKIVLTVHSKITKELWTCFSVEIQSE